MPIRHISFLLAVFWIGLETYLSSQSTLPTPDIFSGQDKLFHAIYYCVLTILFLGCCKFSAPDYTFTQKFISMISASVYGAIDELHQYYVPGRYADILDWVADTVGALVAVFLVSWSIRKYRFIKINNRQGAKVAK